MICETKLQKGDTSSPIYIHICIYIHIYVYIYYIYKHALFVNNLALTCWNIRISLWIVSVNETPETLRSSVTLKSLESVHDKWVVLHRFFFCELIYNLWGKIWRSEKFKLLVSVEYNNCRDRGPLLLVIGKGTQQVVQKICFSGKRCGYKNS